METSEKVIGSKYQPPSYGKEIMLTIIEDVDADQGKGICRLDPEARAELEVNVGDFVDVIGPKTLKYRVERLEEICDKRGCITISKDLREGIPFSGGVKVFVRKSIK
jgi:hypothetical protein